MRRDNRQKRDFDQKVLDVARVTRVVKGGRRFRFRTAVVIGNKKGRVGLSIAKGSDVSDSVNKAVNKAKKKMINVPITEAGTIPHEIQVKFKAAKIMLKPAGEGRGIIAGGVVRVIAELAGIKNLTGKILGTHNKYNNALAVMIALSRLKPVKSAKRKVQNEKQQRKTKN
tara:strand:+ start:93 stop:602 length:510 start_codon:yes stop_codon:yes gene_type:complete